MPVSACPACSCSTKLTGFNVRSTATKVSVEVATAGAGNPPTWNRSRASPWTTCPWRQWSGCQTPAASCHGRAGPSSRSPGPLTRPRKPFECLPGTEGHCQRRDARLPAEGRQEASRDSCLKGNAKIGLSMLTCPSSIGSVSRRMCRRRKIRALHAVHMSLRRRVLWRLRGLL